MTLVEILVVVALIALATSMVTLGLGAITHSRLRSGCMRLAAAAHFAYNRAIADGKTLRVVVDMQNSHLSIEQSRTRDVTLARVGDPRRTDNTEDAEKDEAAVDPWAAARARLADTLKPTLGRSPFGPLTGSDGKPLARYRNVSLGRGVRVIRMILPHEPVPREKGQGAIYFFPSGMTEHAVVQLSDLRGDQVYSLELHALTGQSKLYDHAFVPEDVSETGASEVEGP